MPVNIRKISEREIAITLLLTMADHNKDTIGLLGFYDDDFDLLVDLSKALDVTMDKAFDAKLKRVVRTLVNNRVFSAQMRGTHKEYLGEPAKQMEYTLKCGKLGLLQRGRTEHTMDPRGEAGFLIRHAYPNLAYD